MGLVNAVVPLAQLEEKTVTWCFCYHIMPSS